jgi:hypothetical protein
MAQKSQELSWDRSKIYHDAVGENDIRMLILDMGKPDEPLFGHLYTTSLDELPNYTAISYEWDGQSPTEEFELLNGNIRITKNLNNAIRRVRHSEYRSYIWADALCINQENISERNAQVRNMGLIYSRAYRVIVWLGDPSPRDALAFGVAHLLADFATRLNITLRSGTRESVSYVYEEFRKQIKDPEAYVTCRCCQVPVFWPQSTFTEAFAALDQLWRKSWFFRAWVIQEVGLSGDRCTFTCGPHHAPAEILFFALLVHMLLSDFRPCDFLETDDALYAILVLTRRYERVVRYQSDIEDLMDLLLLTSRGVRATDPHDLVYAMRALSFMEQVPALNPDYSIGIPELWRRVTLAVLTRPPEERRPFSGSVILSLPSTQKDNPNRRVCLPTWVPDIQQFTIQAENRYMDYQNLGTEQSAGGPSRTIWAQAKPGLPLMLQLKGIVHSRIEAILPDSQYTNMNDLTENLIPWYFRCRRFALTRGWRHKDMKFTIGRLLLQGKEPRPVPSHRIEFHRKALAHWRKKARERLPWIKQMDDVPLIALVLDLGWYFIPRAEFGAKLEIPDRMKVLAVTTDGRCAWVPECAEVGDHVFLCQGAPFPFVLRKVGVFTNWYKLIGDGYVHGIENGEAWPENDEDRLVVVDLE